MRRMIGVITVLMMSQAAATAEPQQIDLDVPSTAVAATVQINVKPSKGAVLLYTGPSYDKPIRFPGRQARGWCRLHHGRFALNWSRGQSHSTLKSLGILMASMDRKSNLRRDDARLQMLSALTHWSICAAQLPSRSCLLGVIRVDRAWDESPRRRKTAHGH